MLLFYPAYPRLLDRIHPQPDHSLSPLTGYLEMPGKPYDLNSLLERCRGPKEREARNQPKEEVYVTVPTVTLIGPVVAPAGTVVVRLLAVAAVTVAVVPLNFTVLAVGVALKFCP